MSKSNTERLNDLMVMAGYKEKDKTQKSADSREMIQYIEHMPEAQQAFKTHLGLLTRYASKIGFSDKSLIDKMKYYMHILATGEAPFRSLEHAFSSQKDHLKASVAELYRVEQDMAVVEEALDPFYATLIDRQYESQKKGMDARKTREERSVQISEVNELLKGDLSLEEQKTAKLLRRDFKRQFYNASIACYTSYVVDKLSEHTMQHMDHLQALVFGIYGCIEVVRTKAHSLAEEAEQLIPMYDRMLTAMKQGIMTDQMMRDFQNKYVTVIAMTGRLTEQAQKILSTSQAVDQSRHNMARLNQDLADRTDETLDMLVQRTADAKPRFRMDR
jgi:hypothetical protein